MCVPCMVVEENVCVCMCVYTRSCSCASHGPTMTTLNIYENVIANLHKKQQNITVKERFCMKCHCDR